MRQIFLSSLLPVACTGCAAPLMRSTLLGPPTPAQLSELWEEPTDPAERNLFDGPWGKDLAPNPTATYAFVSEKTVGVSPGFAVTDEHGMEWSIKQGPEAKVEVVASRVLSAVGYHQPPVYYLPRWTLSGGFLATRTAGGSVSPEAHGPERCGRMVLASESVYRDPAVRRTPGLDDDPERIRPEELEQHGVRGRRAR